MQIHEHVDCGIIHFLVAECCKKIDVAQTLCVKTSQIFVLKLNYSEELAAETVQRKRISCLNVQKN